MNKLLSLLLSVLFIFFSFSFSFTSTTYAGNIKFSDVRENDWFYSDVQKLVDLGAISGHPDGSFKPNDNIRRAEFVKILVNALNLQVASGHDLLDAGNFTDIENHWAKGSIHTAVANGVITVSEYGNKFEPEKPITRLEMAKMIVRALKLSPSAGKNPFVDIDDGYTTAAYHEYLITGVINGGKRYFYPFNNATRAEASAVIMRAVEYNANPRTYKANKEKQSAASNQNSTAVSFNDKILGFIEKYDYDGYYILNEAVKSKFNISFWFRSDNIYSEYFANNLESAVHEMCHLYSLVNGNNGGTAIYLGSGKSINVKNTAVFPTNEITPTIPENLKTYRYETYIGGHSQYVSANDGGIHGLLNEFTAYYFGTKTAYNLYNYYLSTVRNMSLDTKIDAWSRYLGLIDSTHYAYAEFRYYMLKYLLYAKEKHPDIYNGIMANKEFKIAFNTIEQEYYNLIQLYFNRIDEFVKFLQDSGCKVWEEDGKIMIKYSTEGGSTITRSKSLSTNVYHMLMDEMNKPEYQEIIKELKIY